MTTWSQELIPDIAATTKRTEVAELYKIVAFLETQLRTHALSLAAARDEKSASAAQCVAQRGELDAIRSDRDRLREHVVGLQLSVQELSDRLKQSEARNVIGDVIKEDDNNNNIPLPRRFYDELSRVENLLAAERRVNAELQRENVNYRRLVLTRERELLNVTKKSEIVAESESSSLVAAEQRLALAQRRAADFEEENRALLTVQRAKTRTIEKLSDQLATATEQLSRQRANDNELASLRERHERTTAALAAARADIDRQNRQIEQLQARSTGIPVELWQTERSSMRERIAELESRANRADASASSSATTARGWAARWRRLAAAVTAQSTSLSALRTLVRKQREGEPLDDFDDNDGSNNNNNNGSSSSSSSSNNNNNVDPYGSTHAARETMAMILGRAK
jgi:chromosome segregation ATPase